MQTKDKRTKGQKDKRTKGQNGQDNGHRQSMSLPGSADCSPTNQHLPIREWISGGVEMESNCFGVAEYIPRFSLPSSRLSWDSGQKTQNPANNETASSVIHTDA